MSDLLALLSVLPPMSAAQLEDRRRAQFGQACASLALEGLQVDDTDLDIQQRVASGAITSDQAVSLYVQAHKRGA